MDILFKISIVLMVGVLGGKIARVFKLPNVTGYLVFGLFIGPSFINFIKEGDIQSFESINDLSLAVIAFSIGSEFLLNDLLKVGKTVFVIALTESLGAASLVFSLMYFVLHQPLEFSLVIAGISAATAPAATMMVIKQYRAHGPLTKTVLPVVALDDAIGIIVFGVTLSIAKLSMGNIETNFLQMVIQPIMEIFGSLIFGIIIGIILALIAKKTSNREELLAIILAVIGCTVGITKMLNLSALLTCMMIGATLVNLVRNSNHVFSLTGKFIAPVYIIFFALAGASLDINILPTVGIIGVVYIFARAAGKMIGAWAGAVSMKADKAVAKYLGLTLLPQGGVAIGLAIIVSQEISIYSEKTTTIIMFSILIYEIIGPVLAKIAFQKAKETNEPEKLKKEKKVVKHVERLA